jgi:hypothetical protein
MTLRDSRIPLRKVVDQLGRHQEPLMVNLLDPPPVTRVAPFPRWSLHKLRKEAGRTAQVVRLGLAAAVHRPPALRHAGGPARSGALEAPGGTTGHARDQWRGFTGTGFWYTAPPRDRFVRGASFSSL